MSDLFIVGASVRAAAASALRAGFRPWCIDLFGDADLVRACPARTAPLAGYVRAMTEMLRDGPPGPWMYTGGFENHPSLGTDVNRPLLGNSSHGVLAVRNPSLVAEHLAALGFHVPRIHPLLGGGNRRWLVKPYRGSGGLEVRMLTPGQLIDPKHAYLQEFIDGIPVSAVCIGRAGGVTLVGGSRQLIGTPWLHAARPFQYAGSIGPLRHPPLLAQFQRLGETLAENFFLRGLFGIDAIYDGARVWPIEVNPRYTASVEVLERATGRRRLADHAAAFVPLTNPIGALEPWAETALANKTDPDDTGVPGKGSHGKAILFAEHDIIFPDDGPWLAAFDHALGDLDVPFADIPMPRHPIPRGDPVLTFFARGQTSQDCENELRKIAADLDRALFRR